MIDDRDRASIGAAPNTGELTDRTWPGHGAFALAEW